MPSPLHPAVVHFPLVLAALLPFLAAAALLVLRRPGTGRGPWIALVAFAVLLALSAWAAVATGSQQEDIVRRVVSGGAIHGHEEAAEGFLSASVLLAVMVSAGLLPGLAGRIARYATVAASLAVLGLALRTGASGGKLVYEQGAAAAYVTRPTGTLAALPAATRAGDDEDDEGEENH